MTRPIAKRRGSNSAWQIFRWPLLIAALSLAGLVSALVGDGIYDFVSWLALGGVTVATLLMLVRRR